MPVLGLPGTFRDGVGPISLTFVSEIGRLVLKAQRIYWRAIATLKRSSAEIR
jgi:hypothetical protein